MDRVEDIERDRAGDRLGGRDVNTERVSEVETENQMSAMLQDYDVVPSEHGSERSPPILELAEHYREYILNKSTQFPTIRRTLPSPPISSFSPHSAMDISSVRFRPVPVMAQAAMTSTQGHPRLTWSTELKYNISTNQYVTIVLIMYLLKDSLLAG